MSTYLTRMIEYRGGDGKWIPLRWYSDFVKSDHYEPDAAADYTADGLGGIDAHGSVCDNACLFREFVSENDYERTGLGGRGFPSDMATVVPEGDLKYAYGMTNYTLEELDSLFERKLDEFFLEYDGCATNAKLDLVLDEIRSLKAAAGGKRTAGRKKKKDPCVANGLREERLPEVLSIANESAWIGRMVDACVGRYVLPSDVRCIAYFD